MENPCPNCGAELTCDEVDIGVGVQQGNWRCEECGWEPYGGDRRLACGPDEEDELCP